MTPKEIAEAHRLGDILLQMIQEWKRDNIPVPGSLPLKFSPDERAQIERRN